MVATAVRFEHMPARTGEKVSLPSAEMNIETLAETRLYSEELEIDLRAGNDKEIFKWFLASLLFGARITETIAKNTYRAFERHRLLDPKKILGSGWEFLVSPIMSEGGYVRYDGRKSTQILRDCEWLLDRYEREGRPLRGCEPRDLIDRARDFCTFHGRPLELSEEILDLVWTGYFGEQLA